MSEYKGKELRIMPDVIHTIAENAYADDMNVKKVVIGKQTCAIKHKAFANCVNLKILTLPAMIRYIDGTAFQNCKELTDITVNSSDYKFQEIYTMILKNKCFQTTNASVVKDMHGNEFPLQSDTDM